MTHTFSAHISQAGKWYVAQCIEVDITSQGETKEAALTNLREALELHFEEPHFEQPRTTISPEIRTFAVELEVELNAS